VRQRQKKFEALSLVGKSIFLMNSLSFILHLSCSWAPTKKGKKKYKEEEEGKRREEEKKKKKKRK
jgi:hypothetical protein